MSCDCEYKHPGIGRGNRDAHLQDSRMTHTYAILEISRAAYDEIRAKLEAASYQHTFIQKQSREVIDMHGIAVAIEPEIS
jgi:hypothetical protein